MTQMFYNPYMQNPYQIQNQFQNQYQYQQPMQTMQSVPMPNTQQLNGQIVDSIEAVRAKDVDLSGNPVYYPNANGTEIYKKQLMMDGTSKITVYKLSDISDPAPVNDSANIEQLKQSIESLRTDVMAEIKRFSDMLGE